MRYSRSKIFIFQAIFLKKYIQEFETDFIVSNVQVMMGQEGFLEKVWCNNNKYR